MKFAVIFLLASCLVGVSYQQRFIWSMPYAPRPHLTPLFYADGQPAGNIDVILFILKNQTIKKLNIF